MKKLRTKGNVIAMCGPRDSGKTTLVSKLLHKPDLALAAGFRGGTDETRRVTPYSIPGAPGYVILDTPGLTGPEEMVRRKFDLAALNPSSTFVYVREYEGLPTEVDLKAIKRILECAARARNPRILVCLNRCKDKLTEDATGEIFHLSADREKKVWLSRLHELRSRIPSWMNHLWSISTVTVAFVELKGDRELERQMSDDYRTDGIWTASSIGKWISENVFPSHGEPTTNWALFESHMDSFQYREWQAGVRACRAAKEAEELESVQRAFDL